MINIIEHSKKLLDYGMLAKYHLTQQRTTKGNNTKDNRFKLYRTKQGVKLMQETNQLYNELTTAYNYYNNKLFNDKLPDCIITLHRDKKTLGYYIEGIWNKETITELYPKGTTNKIDEIALNPTHFKDRTIQEILSTLVHEQCHQYHYHHGKNPPRKGYHTKEFAAIMSDIGLQTSSTGKEGGKTTGQKMSHYVIEGGMFAIVTKELIDSGFVLSYVDTWDRNTKKKKKAAASKTKYTCEGCDSNAWAKPETKLLCGDCYTLSGEMITMTAEVK